MATYTDDVIRENGGIPIPVKTSDGKFNVDAAWEGNTHQAVESFLSGVIAELSETTTSKISVSVPTDNFTVVGVVDSAGNPIVFKNGRIINFLNGTEYAYCQYRVSYMEGDEEQTSYRVSILVNGEQVYDNVAIGGSDFVHTCPVNLAPYLKKYSSLSLVSVTIRAYSGGTGYDTADVKGSTTINFNRVQGSLALSGMTSFDTINTGTINYTTEFTSTAASPYAYLRVSIVSDGQEITFGETAARYIDLVVTTPGVYSLNLGNILTNGYSALNNGINIVTARLYIGRRYDGSSIVDEGEPTPIVVYKFLRISSSVENGTPYVIADYNATPSQNDYTDIMYMVYVKGQPVSYTTPILLREYDLTANMYKTVAIKVVNNQTQAHWNYFVPKIAVSQQNLQVALPRRNEITGEIEYDSNGEPIAITDPANYYTTIELRPTASSVRWSVMSPVFHLSARNKSNSDYDVGTLRDTTLETSGSITRTAAYSMEFENFQWAQGGSGYEAWPTSDPSSGLVSGSMAIKFTGNSRARIKKTVGSTTTDFTPFYDTTPYSSINRVGGGLLAKGLTLKIVFAVSNVSDPSQKIIQCYDDTSTATCQGFYVTGNALYINPGSEMTSDPNQVGTRSNSHNERRFAINNRIELTITVQPYWDSSNIETAHEVRYYVNGEIAGFRKLTNDADAPLTTISQTIAKQLVFGGEGATLHLFDVKYLNRCCTAYEVLQDYCMSLDSSVLLNSFYTKNAGTSQLASGRFYTEETIGGVLTPVLKLQDAINYGKWLAGQNKTDFSVFVLSNMCNGPDYVDTQAGTGNTEEHAKRCEFLYMYRFKYDDNPTSSTYQQGIIDPDLTYYLEGQYEDGTGGALTWKIKDGQGRFRLRRQGTSTASGTKSNVRWDTRGVCRLHKWNPVTGAFSETYTSVKKKAKIFYIPDKNAIPCFIVTAKKNVNESTHVRNVPTAKWVEACTRQLAKVSSTYEDVLTPPQRAEMASIQSAYAATGQTIDRNAAIDMIKTRQVIDGIPSVGFEISYEKNPSLWNESDGTHITTLDPTATGIVADFSGQFDLTTDKKNMEVFGFGGYTEWIVDNGKIKTRWVDDNVTGDPLGDTTWINDDGISQGDESNSEDFSFEYKDNSAPLCSFKVQDLSGATTVVSGSISATSVFEYRFPEDRIVRAGTYQYKPGDPELLMTASIGLTRNGPMQRIYNLVQTCDPEKQGYGYYAEGNQFITDGTGKLHALDGTEFNDDITGRRGLFKHDLKYYAVVNQLLLYYLSTVDIPQGVDQEGKNIFMGHHGAKGSDEGDYSEYLNISGSQVRWPILRIHGYDYDTNWSIDNRNNFKFLYTMLYEDHLYDAGGCDLWDLIKVCYATELAQMKQAIGTTLISKAGVEEYMFTKHIDLYNSLQFNANSEYGYTLLKADYPKSHGSAREHTEWFVNGRMNIMAGRYFPQSSISSQAISNEYTQGTFRAGVSTGGGLSDAAYHYRMGYFRGDTSEERTENRFGVSITGRERCYVGMAAGSPLTYYGNSFIPVTPVTGSNDMIVDYERPVVTIKLPTNYDPQSNDGAVGIGGCSGVQTISGLDRWYINKIEGWGGLVNVEELVLGTTGSLPNPDGTTFEQYENSELQNLGDTSGVTFGSCKLLNLAGCSGISELALTSFPELETFEGRGMTKLIRITLPVTSNLKTAHFPANLVELNIRDKSQLGEGTGEVTFEGYDKIETVDVENSSDFIAQDVISKFL